MAAGVATSIEPSAFGWNNPGKEIGDG